MSSYHIVLIYLLIFTIEMNTSTFHRTRIALYTSWNDCVIGEAIQKTKCLEAWTEGSKAQFRQTTNKKTDTPNWIILYSSLVKQTRIQLQEWSTQPTAGSSRLDISSSFLHDYLGFSQSSGIHSRFITYIISSLYVQWTSKRQSTETQHEAEKHKEEEMTHLHTKNVCAYHSETIEVICHIQPNCALLVSTSLLELSWTFHFYSVHNHFCVCAWPTKHQGDGASTRCSGPVLCAQKLPRRRSVSD